MEFIIYSVLFLIAWFAFQIFILPRLGLPT